MEFNNDINCSLTPPIGYEFNIGCNQSLNICQELYGDEFGTKSSSSGCKSPLFNSTCILQSYKGDDIECCTLYALQSDKCVSSNKICKPNRNIYCPQVYYNLCSNDWSNNKDFCELYTEYLFETDQDLTVFNNVLDNSINKINNNDIFNFCKRNPEICEQQLYRSCSNVTSDNLIHDNNRRKYCGCYMTMPEYYKYIKYGVPKECTPVCNKDDIINLPFKSCNNSVCLIDNISIDIEKSKGDDINFEQICNNCNNNSNCQCKISNVNIDITESEFNDIKFSQLCNGNVQCVDVNGNDIDCDFISFKNEKNIEIPYLYIGLLILFIMVMFFMYLSSI